MAAKFKKKKTRSDGNFRKLNQTYTDILDRLEQVKDNLGEDYATEISMLKDKIIEQLAVVQAELDKKRETIQ